MTDISPTLAAAVAASVQEAEKITIATHIHPDGDAIGSSMGLYHYLVTLGKSPRIVLNDRIPDSLSFLAEGAGGSILVYEDSPEKTAAAVAESGLIFCLDMNTFSRAEHLEAPLRDAGCRKILVDHHLHPDRKLFGIVLSETEVSSTAELLYNLLLSLPGMDGKAERLPVKTAEALLAGMTTDTNNFANSVYPSTFRMASELLAAGIDRNAVVSKLYTRYRENRFRLMGEMLKDRLEITVDGVALMVIDKPLAKKYDIQDGETEGFVNIPLGIENVRMSLLLKEEDDKFRVSIRSKTGTSANRCAAMYFNGGGHELAAGGRLVKGKDIGADAGADEAGDYVRTYTAMFLEKESQPSS